ncbi:acyltransferase [Tatumella sp. UCD-D_suzukii]|uniref:acyltransferase family protein n=1 Tax=Tatumella sp. UCD-D_suzukii TaxID=1408192 RepID=UPI000472F175|nr:acyltransferase [Tatumella sp. UCD-D_suzukii]
MYVLSAILSIALSIFVLSRLNYQKDIYNKSGVVSITGARCFLALLVMMSHATHYLYEKNNEWIFDGKFKLPFGLNNFYATSGKLGVLVFFMISGFLFYRVVYKDEVDLKSLFIKRIKRILPLYWFSMILIIAVGCLSFRPEMSTNTLFGVVRWATFVGTYSIGEINTSIINSGVDWSLKIEWMLYLSIIPLSLLTRGMSDRKKDLFIILSILLIMAAAAEIRMHGHIYTDPRPVLGFVSGLFAYRVSSSVKSLKKSKAASTIALISVVLSLFACIYAGYYLVMLGLCTVFFVVISSGNSIFGILENKTIVSIGEVSYSIYLLHGIILYLMMKASEKLPQDFYESFIFCTLFNFLLIISSAYLSKVTYKNIELRFYKGVTLNTSAPLSHKIEKNCNQI